MVLKRVSHAPGTAIGVSHRTLKGVPHGAGTARGQRPATAPEPWNMNNLHNGPFYGEDMGAGGAEDVHQFQMRGRTGSVPRGHRYSSETGPFVQDHHPSPVMNGELLLRGRFPSIPS